MTPKPKKGNIILINYRFDFISWLIRKICISKWNHAAFMINDEELIEVTKIGGLTITKVKKYYWKLLYIIEFFDTNLCEKEINEVINYALYLKKNKPNTNWFINGILVLLNKPYKMTGYTCSGFVATCFSKIGFYFNKYKNPKVIFPEDIYQYFKNINNRN